MAITSSRPDCRITYQLGTKKKEKAKCWYSWTQQNVQVWFWFMVSNATFKNIWVISWRSVLLVQKNGVPGENHRPVTSYWKTWYYTVVSSTPRGSNKKCTIGKLKSECYEIWVPIFYLYVQGRSFRISSMFNFE